MRNRPLPSAALILLAAIPWVVACGDGKSAPAPVARPPVAPPPATPRVAPAAPSAAAPAAPANVLPPSRATKSGRFFTVELHADVGSGSARDAAARTAADALSAAELAGDRYAELIGETNGRLALAFTADRGGLVTIHVWPDAATAATASAPPAGASTESPPPGPDTHVANSHEVTGTGRTPAPSALHVALTPALPAMAVDEVGLPSQTIRAISRAASAVFRSRRFPDAAPQPAWIADGQAEDLGGYVAGSVWAAANARVAKPGTIARRPEPDPWDAEHLLIVSRMLERHTLPSAADVMAGRTSALGGAERTPVHATLYGALTAAFAGRPATALFVPADASGGAPAGAALPPDVAALMDAGGAADLDHVWRERIAAARPGWDCETLSISRLPGDRDWLLVGGPDRPDAAPTFAWRMGDDRDASLAISGRVSILLGSRSGSVARVLLGRRGDGCLAVEFGPGTLALARCDASTRAVTTIAAVERPILRPGQTIQFEVVVIQGRVAVFVDGKETLTKDVEASAVTGPWGLGVTNGSAVAWRGLSSGR